MKINIVILVCLLLCAGCNGKENARKDLEAKGVKYSQESFQDAIYQGNQVYVDLFLKSGMDPDAKVNNMTPLCMAANNHNISIVEKLLKYKANVNAKCGTEEKTALIQAAIVSDKDIVTLLLNKGSEVNAKTNKGISALHQAITNGNKDIVSSLLNKGADINIKTSEGMTLLHEAAALGNKEFIALLISKGAVVDQLSGGGESPLVTAIGYDKVEAVEALLAGGANVDLKILKDHLTALMIASSKGNKAIIEALIKKGANINAKDDDGVTPIFFAITSGKPEVVKFLLDKGADKNARLSNGISLYDFAINKGHREIANLFIPL